MTTRKSATPKAEWLIHIGESKPGHWIEKLTVDPDRFVRRKLYTVLLHEDQSWTDFISRPLPWADDPLACVVMVYEVQPINAVLFEKWAAGLATQDIQSCRVLVRPLLSEDPETVARWFESQLVDLLPAVESSGEKVAFRVCQHVNLDGRSAHRGSPTELLYGPMQQVSEELEQVRKEFLRLIDIGDDTRKRLLEIVEPILRKRQEGSKRAGPDPESAAFDKYTEECKRLGWDKVDRNAIPKILLLGETGVGKTMIASSLARNLGGGASAFRRVSLPEFSFKEAAFEYDMFGFKGGSFTDAPADGQVGILASNMGGVVFLDEIGEATPTMQAKLLTYLDDFQTRPRGVNRSFFCPTLIVAATNQDLSRLAKAEAGKFRQDLLMRFSTHITVPSLNTRKEWLPLIVDALLQSQKINPDYCNPKTRIRAVTSIGINALRSARDYDYTDKNFRYFEDMLRKAVRRAQSQGRQMIQQQDMVFA